MPKLTVGGALLSERVDMIQHSLGATLKDIDQFCRGGPMPEGNMSPGLHVYNHARANDRSSHGGNAQAQSTSTTSVLDRFSQSPMTVSALTSLQRVVGNAAVAGVVVQRQAAPPVFDVREYIDDAASPGLTEAVAMKARDALAGNQRQEALNILVDALVDDGRVTRDFLFAGRMRYDPGLAGEGAARVPKFSMVDGRRAANPTRVRLGPAAFRGGLPLLYSSILHEYRHVEQFQRINSVAEPLSGQNDWLENRQEVDAYLHEIENAHSTGLFANPRQIREAWRRLQVEHWINVDRAGRRILNDRYIAAHAIVRQAVGPDIRLGFSPL